MVIGALGDIVFTVSSRTLRTISSVKWSGAARYSTHRRHGTHALTEFTGLDPDTLSFEMVLLSSLGVNPMDELVKLWDYERNARAVPLVIGDHAYGKYRWSVVSHDIKVQHFDAAGRLMSVTVSVKLQEYLRE